MSLFHDVFFPRDVFAEVDGLARRLDARTSRGLDGRHGLSHATAGLVPQLALDESDTAYVLTADVPGLCADALTVSFEDGVLTVRGDFTSGSDDETTTVDDGWQVTRVERHAANFERKVRFHRAVDAGGVTATLTDGVLRIEVPKRAPTTVSIPVVTH